VPLGPAGVHALQHLGPILRLGAAGAGVDLDEGVVAVGLAGQQAFDLAALGLRRHRLQGGHGVRHHGGVAVALGQLDQLHAVGDLNLQLADGVDAGGDAGAFAHEDLRRFGIAPERRVLGAVVQLLKAGEGDIPVKDASLAGPRNP